MNLMLSGCFFRLICICHILNLCMQDTIDLNDMEYDLAFIHKLKRLLCTTQLKHHFKENIFDILKWWKIQVWKTHSQVSLYSKTK